MTNTNEPLMANLEPGDEGQERRPVHPVLKPLTPVGRALYDWWREALLLAGSSLAWAALSLTIVLGPPAGAALFSVSRAAILHEHIEARVFIQAMRRYFLKSWALALVSLGAIFLWAVDLQFYLAIFSGQGIMGTIGVVFFIYLGLLVLQVLLYAWAQMVCRDDLKVTHLLRNGLILAMRYPVHNTVALIFIAIMVFIGIIIPPIYVLVLPTLVPLVALHSIYILVPGLVPDDVAVLEMVS